MNSKTGQSTIIESPEIEVNTHMGVQCMKNWLLKSVVEMIHYSINVVDGPWLAMWKKNKVKFMPRTIC